MAKTFDFNAIKGIKLVDKSGKVKDEAVKSKLGDQNLFRFKEGIVWAKPYNLRVSISPKGVNVSVKRTSTYRSLAKTGEIATKNGSYEIYHGDKIKTEVTKIEGYYDPEIIYPSEEVTGDTVAYAWSDGVIQLKLSAPPLKNYPSINSCEVTRTGTLQEGSETFVLSQVYKNEETIYYGDNLSVVVSSIPYYEPAKAILSENENIKGDVTITFEEGKLKVFALKYPATIEGLETYRITRTSSYIAETGVLVDMPMTAGEVPIYYGDNLLIEVKNKEGYTDAFATMTDGVLYGKSIVVYDDIEARVDPVDVLEYSLTIPALVEGVESCTITRVGTLKQTSRTFNCAGVEQKATIYYGDTLTINPVIKEGYNVTATLTATEVKGDVVGSLTSQIKQFTLTIPSLPTGVKSLTVTRTSSPLANASKGELSNDATIYYGDSLVVSTVATDGYTNPSVNISSVSVKSDVSISVTAGEIKKHTVTFDLNGGEESNVPTSMVVEHGAIINMEAYLPPYRVDEDNYSYEFNYWEANGAEGSEFRITEDTHIVARYYRQAYPAWHYMKLSNTSWDVIPSPTGQHYTTVSGEIYKTNSKIMAVPTRFHTGTDGHMIMTGAEGDSARFTMNKAGIVLDSGSSKYSSSGTGYYGNGFGYSLTASKGKINFYVWADRIQDDDKWYGNEAGQIFYLTSGHITLNAIEQFYSDPSENAIV